MPSDDAEIIRLMKEEKQSQGMYGVVRGMEGDKKKAADSIAIEQETGKDANRVYGDYENQNKRVKSDLAQSIVEKDERLLKYIEGNPLASTVSKDDWGNLATYTGLAKKLTDHVNNPILKVFKDAAYLHDIIYPGDASHFMRGLVTGLAKDNPDLAAEFIEGMSYNMPESFRPSMFTGAKAIRDFAASVKPEGYERTMSDTESLHGIGDHAAWGMESFGGAIASMVPGVVLGLGGAAVGGPVGAAAGFAVPSYAMGYGEVFKALKDEGIDPALANKYSLIAAPLIAALDLASMESLVGKIPFTAMKRDLTKYIAVRIAKEVAKGATTEGLTETMQEIIKDATVSYAADKKFGTPEQIRGWVESGIVGAMTGGIIQGGHGALAGTPRQPKDLDKDLLDIKKGVDAARGVMENGKPWIAAGQRPPKGIDPTIDHFLAMESQERIEILDAIMDNADKTETKELSPPLWQELQKILYEKKQIEIKWDAVKALYGDKVPEPDDKLLGFIPNIQKQFENSNLTGEAIKVNIADWVGKVDPDVNKMLHDDLSFSDGMTINEVKTKPPLEDKKEIHEKEIPGLADELDKPYSLKKGEEGVYEVRDEAGGLAARVRVVENEGGKNLHIHFRSGQVDPAGMRTLLKQLKEEYPNAETITSPKVAGVEWLRRALGGQDVAVGMPFRIKESTIDIVRRSAGLEPLFDLPRDKPRTVTLTRNKGQGIYPGDVSFTITDEMGQEVGVIEGATRQKGKDLYVDWIGMPVGSEEGERGLVNKLGPRLVRNLFRQFKEVMPGLKTITGFRATGSREKYGRGEVVQVDIARFMEELEKAPDGWETVEGGVIGPEHQKLVDLTQGYAQFGPNLWAQRSREWTPQELEIERRITRLMDKIAPKEVQVLGAEDIRKGKEQRRIHGVMQMYYHRRPLILWALSSKDPSLAHDPVGTARHEAVHFLRQYGYISEKEWEALTKHVMDNNLIEHHGIDTRYPDASEELRIEEAIAEEFRVWSRQAEPTTVMDKVFDKIKEILDNIRLAYREYMGREPTVDDVFRGIDIGRVGSRTPGPAIEPRLHRAFEQRGDISGPEGLEQRPPEAPLDDNAFRDAGFTESEIRDGLTEEQKAAVRDGYLYVGGTLQPATPEMLAEYKEKAAKDAEQYAETIKKLNHAFAQKAGYPPIKHIMPGDWRAKGNTPKEFRDSAYADTEQRFSYNQRMVEKIERQLARRPPVYDPGGPVEGEGAVPMMEPGAIMDKARYGKYHRHINQRNDEDTQKEIEDAAREIRRKNKPEWKAKEAEMKAEVNKEIANRPDWKVSQFFRNGMFFGMDSKYRPKIDPQYLTPEQAAGLPDQFIKKGGMNPDDLAGSFGYSSGKAMVDRMVEFERVKGKLGPKEFFDEMVKQETNRRMDMKYGKSAEEDLKEAMDHVIGTTQMDLLHEETLALALRAGMSFTLTKEDFKKMAAIRFHDEIASEISMRGYFREMYRAGKTAELAFLNGDFVTAFQQKQQQVHLFSLAEMAKKFEREQKQIDDIIKRYNKRDHDVKKIPPEFVEWIHSILFQINRPPKRMPDDLHRHIDTRDAKTLLDFVKDKNYMIMGNEEFETEVNPNLVIWDKLWELDANGQPVFNKKFEDLTVGEVKLVNASLQSLNKIGRDEGKYNTKYESRVLKDMIGQMKNQLSRLGEKADPGMIKKALQFTHGGLVQLEGMFDRWDRGNRHGLFTKMFSFPLSKASDDFSTAQREMARRIIALDKRLGITWKEGRTLVDNDVFYNPKWMEFDENKELIDNGKWLKMTKEHVRGVLLNWGNPSNRQRLAEGYRTTEEKIQGWLDKVATKEDYEWAGEVGKIYKDIQKESDEMTYRMSGTFTEMLPLPKFMTPHGEMEGYYYPIIYDWSKGGGAKLQKDRPPPTVELTYTGWQRKRTGSAGPLDLSLGEMGNFISRRLKDNAFREVLHNIHKVWSNKDFQNAVRRYHGDYGVNLLNQAYKDFAGHTGITAGVSNAGNQFAEAIRQNTIGVLIGWNPGTVMKHGASAMLQSWQEAGIFKSDFYKSMTILSNPVTRGEAVKFMMEGGKVGDLDFKGSGTLNRRHQHYQETIGGASDVQLRKLTVRERALHIGSTPVAWSDMYSSQILWHAKYTKIMDQLNGTMPIEEAHTIAEEQANYAVRRTHGSTAITSRPEFMRTQSAVVRNLTSLYGFFNHIYNRFYRMAWMTKDLIKDKKSGDISWGEFSKGAGELTGDFMMYIAGPAFIEAVVVEGLMSADWDDMGWGEIMAKGMTHTVSASVPLVRDVVHAQVTGHDPAGGLIPVSMKGFTDLARDLSREEIDVGKVIQHSTAMLGIATGVGSMQAGRWLRFLYNWQSGEEAPREFEEFYRAFRTGSTALRKGH